MKSLLTLHISVLRNAGQICSVDTARDVETMSRRVEDEGDGFLTILLPKLGKALEKGLAQGFWPAQDVAGTFQHHRGLPALLRGFLSRIFGKDGVLLDNPDAECVWAVRQVVYLTHKIERPCTPERVGAAFNQFLVTDKELEGLMDRIDPSMLDHLDRAFHQLFGGVLQASDLAVANFELVPRHGPGAVADRLSQKERRSFDYWTERLQDVFPHWRYTSNTPNWRDDHVVPIEDETPVRVVAVPKTQSTPRIIAIEPSSVQYAQQGLKREFYERIGRDRVLSRILGFSDQQRNRDLALEASLTGKLATLDLSEASDRVSYDLVMHLLRRFPHLRDFVDATRSRYADVEGVGIIRLSKFASMGSALTFPLEAMVFTAAALMGMEQVQHRRIPTRQLPGQLSVYGDDIILPADCAVHVSTILEHFGARVNRHKSFWTGKFRESCGAEFYAGTDVSVVRLRHEVPTSRGDAAELAAFVDFRNRCFAAGLWLTVRDLDQELESLIKLPHANVTDESTEPGYLYLNSSNQIRPISRWNPNLHRDERRVPVLKSHSTTYVIDGEAGLLEWFHNALRKSDLVSRHDSEERPVAFSINYRWAPWR